MLPTSIVQPCSVLPQTYRVTEISSAVRQPGRDGGQNVEPTAVTTFESGKRRNPLMHARHC